MSSPHLPQGVVEIGPLRLKCPPKCELISTANDPKSHVDRLVRNSPDHTIYHLAPYTAYVRQQGPVEVVALVKNGELICAMPVFPLTNSCFQSSFYGMVFPAAPSEKMLKRAIEGTFEFFALNDHIRKYDAIQSVLGKGAMDSVRRAQLDFLLTTHAPPGSINHIFTRVLELAAPPEAARLERQNATGTLSPGELDSDLLKTYDGDMRNQIRQAERNGLTLRYHLIASASEPVIAEAYREYDPVHAESWKRTNLNPHSTAYWHGLSRGIADGGGVDIVVVAFDGERAVAGATCHLYQQQAFYYSGGSLPVGLEKRANPLSLHAAISLCRRLGARWFEVGRFESHESEKLQRIRHYKSQFGGKVLRVNNLSFRRRDWRTVLRDEAFRFRYQMNLEYPLLWKVARHLQPLMPRKS